MRYCLVNVSSGNLQIDLFSPDPVPYKQKNLHRMSPTVAVSLPKGSSVDILKYFENSVEKAHAAVKHSVDVLKLVRPGVLSVRVLDDDGKEIDPDALMGKKPKEESEWKEEVASSVEPETTEEPEEPKEEKTTRRKKKTKKSKKS
jgi:hypothetical protein